MTKQASNETAEFERIAGTFHRMEKQEFLSYIWGTEFAEWDAIAPTTEAIKRATECQNRAELVWDEVHPPRFN